MENIGLKEPPSTKEKNAALERKAIFAAWAFASILIHTKLERIVRNQKKAR
jgi:hypothetical protein